jgi:CDP-glycerol glycerophosphotransferase (TagB/SpsB family)
MLHIVRRQTTKESYSAPYKILIRGQDKMNRGLVVLREGLDVSDAQVRRYIPKKVVFSFSFQVNYKLLGNISF